MIDSASPAKAPAKPNPFVGPAILVIWIALGALIVRQPSGPAVFAFVMVGWILSVMVHEFSHAATAWLGGDRTVTEKGYLSFDPRRYGDLGVSLVIPLIALIMGGIGFPGGAVYIRNDLIRSRLWRSATSLAGPAATLVILLVLTFGLAFWAGWGVEGAGPLALFGALTVLAFLQAMGLILNLLPIPGLDGFGIIRPYLPYHLQAAAQRVGPALSILLLMMFLSRTFSGAIWSAVSTITTALGIQFEYIAFGYSLFHFWR
jgi:Zn-dependent protease